MIIWTGNEYVLIYWVSQRTCTLGKQAIVVKNKFIDTIKLIRSSCRLNAFFFFRSLSCPWKILVLHFRETDPGTLRETSALQRKRKYRAVYIRCCKEHGTESPDTSSTSGYSYLKDFFSLGIRNFSKYENISLSIVSIIKHSQFLIP